MPLPVAIIDKLAFGGNGVCRIDGKVCFVPFSCPGDEVSLKITTQKKSYAIAAIADIITPSPSRSAPLCSIFGVCGGCNWQHINYAVQLEHKRSILAETLWRGARVPAELIDATVPSALQYGYRNRLQFKVEEQKGKLRFGFYRQGSHQVEEAPDGCPVAVSAVNQVLSCFRTILQSYPDARSVSQLGIDVGDSGLIVVIHQNSSVSSAGRAFLKEHSGKFGPCTGLFIKADKQANSEKIWGSSKIAYAMHSVDVRAKPVELTYAPGGFAQVHQRQNIVMLSVIRQLGTFSASEQLLDLYCGNGNFSIPLAAEVASVMGIEGNPDSIQAAKDNKDINGVANIEFFCDDVASAVRRLVDRNLTFDAVLLDPPRAGAGDAIADIIKLKPDKIIYVSCDPSTLARDCGFIIGCGYRVVRSVPIDMFPQTYHIESVTLLCRT